MQLAYHKWLTLKINHAFFGSKGEFDFLVKPSSYLQKRFKAMGILVRKQGNEVHFYAGINSQDTFDLKTLLEGVYSISLQFIVNDAYFFNYTDLAFPYEDTLHLFQSSEASSLLQIDGSTNSKGPNGLLGVKPHRFSLPIPTGVEGIELINESGNLVFRHHLEHPAPFANIDLNLEPEGIYSIHMDGNFNQRFFLSHEYPQKNCYGIIHLNGSHLIGMDNPEASFELNLDARKTYWEYLIMTNKQIEIQEAVVIGKQNTSFEGPTPKTLSNGHVCQAFISSQAIPLRFYDADTNELKVKYTDQFSNSPKEMTIKLPNMTSELIGVFQEGPRKGHHFSTSIIYI